MSSTLTSTPAIAGLPEGVEFVKFAPAGDDDFELVGDSIFKGKRQGAASGVLVKPADGHAFRPLMVFDIRSYTLKPGPENQFMVVQQFPPEEIAVEAKFSVSNSFDREVIQVIQSALNEIKFGE